MHRVRAAQSSGATVIDAVYFDGDESQAFLLSVRLNSAHGLPLSLSDKKAAALRILSDYPEWSDRRLAEVVNLSDKTIAAIRRRAGAELPHHPDQRIGRDGVAYPAARKGEGRQWALELVQANPAASAREVASIAGVSLTTAKNVLRGVRDAGSGPTCKERDMVPAEKTRVIRIEGTLPAVAPDTLIQRLRSDPSLRLTELGRVLLRTMDGAPADPVTWKAVAESLPAHCLPIVAELANHFAHNWGNFAVSIKGRLEGLEHSS
ncbi:hypothetical protein [Nocardia sp. IFM 10818]